MYNDSIFACMNESEKIGDYVHAIELYHRELQERPTVFLYYRICFCVFELHRRDEYNVYYNQFKQQFSEDSLVSRYLAIFHHFFEGDIEEIWRIFDDI